MRKVIKVLVNQSYSNKTQVISECLSKEVPFKYVFDFIELPNVVVGILYNRNINTSNSTLQVSRTYELADE